MSHISAIRFEIRLDMVSYETNLEWLICEG